MLSQFVIVGTLLSVETQRSGVGSVISVSVHTSEVDSTQLDFHIGKDITEHINELNCINGIIGPKGIITKNELVAQKVSILQKKDYQ